MSILKKFFVALALVAVFAAGGAASAGSDVNEVGAVLVYPVIVAFDGDFPAQFETYLTVTNASPDPVIAHASFINGDEDDPTYCYECDFSFPLSGNDTETLIVRWDAVGGVVIESEPDGFGGNFLQHSCPHELGMLVLSLEDAEGRSMTDNVLLGEEILVNYDFGWAFSIPAIPFQGLNGGNGDRKFGFDDQELGKLPRIVAADFIAPDPPSGLFGIPEINAELVLFTPNFTRQFPPSVDCSVTGFDADENAFSRSIEFGCWTLTALSEISPEFVYPNLGLFGQADTHGWLQLNCEAQPRPGSVAGARGGVHGALIQRMRNWAMVRRNDPGAPATPNFLGNSAFARLLYQSVTTGDPVTLVLEPNAFPVGGGDPGSTDSGDVD